MATKRNRFDRFSGCYSCRVCKRQTRNTGDNGQVQLCPQCYELAGIENAILDAPESWPENPSEEKRAVLARYQSEIQDHLGVLRSHGVDVETLWAVFFPEPAGMDDGTQNPEGGAAPETAEPIPGPVMLHRVYEALKIQTGTTPKEMAARQEAREYLASLPVNPAPSLAKSSLERERTMQAEQYVIMTTQLERAAKEAAEKAIAGRISTHEGINISRLATDVAALAAVIASLDRCILSAE